MYRLKEWFRQYKKNRKFTYPGSALVVLGGFVISRGLPLNLGLQILGAVVFGAGVFLIWYGMKHESHTLSPKSPAAKEDTKAAQREGVALFPNTMLLYPDYFEFKHVPDAVGLPWELTNSGKPYHILEKTAEGWKEFRLPDNKEDERYFPPSEYGNAATMLAVKRFLEWTPSLFQKVAFGLCCVIIVIEAIVLVIVSG